MPSFRDTSEREWIIRFDGLTLRALREELKIDLADVTGATYQRLETDDADLTAAVCFLLKNQLASAGMSRESFAAGLVGPALEQAMEAIWGAAKVFFRPRLWSALQSNYKQRMEAMATWDELRPALAILNQPDMPEALKQAAMGQLAEMMRNMTPGDSQALKANLSAIGPDAIQLTSAIDSEDFAASAPAA